VVDRKVTTTAELDGKLPKDGKITTTDTELPNDCKITEPDSNVTNDGKIITTEVDVYIANEGNIWYNVATTRDNNMPIITSMRALLLHLWRSV
jgi:hypothetical protein